MSFLPKLSSFEGPLDLLLHLIEKNKIDIYDIPIAEITDQYMEYLDSADETDTDSLSEFLVMAAALLEIKARMLLPKEESEEDEEDPRNALVTQLLEYRLFKYMSLELKDRELLAGRLIYKTADIPDEIAEYEAPVNYDILLENVTVKKLSAIFRDVMAKYSASVNGEAKKYGRIKKEEISLPQKMDEIRSYISRNTRTSFKSLIEKQPTKENIIAAFLAVLELMKSGEITARQKGEDILIEQAA